MNLPTLDELRFRLDIPPINTGKVLNYRGIVFDNNEGLRAIANEKGEIQISSGIEMAMYMYRGQTKDYGTCQPSVERLEKIPSQLLAFCRNVAFEQALGDHPFVKVVEETKFFNNFLYVDKKGLAQHYGLSTDLVDVTSNFDVAAFFAVCKWNNQINQYLPVRSESNPGVIYRLIPILFQCKEFLGEDDSMFSYVGWQPLHRPEQQRACGVRLTKGQDFGKLPSVQKFHFRHNAAISERIWHSFDQGRTLFPADPAAELAKQALELTCFTRDQIDLAWAGLEAWKSRKYDTKKRGHIEKKEKIQCQDKPVLSWDGLDVERDEQILQEKMDSIIRRVKFRRVMSPKTQHITLSTQPPQ